MHMTRDRQTIEGGRVAAAATHTADELGGICLDRLRGRSIGLGRQVRRVHRPGLQFPGKLQQQLRDIGMMLQRVCPRAVVPPLEPQQLDLQAGRPDLQFLSFLLKLPGLLLQCGNLPLPGLEP
jgi:hypothetical protein